MKFNLPMIRRWHIWLGLGLALPIIIVGVTAILLAHEGSLALGTIKFYPEWLPGNTQLTSRPPKVMAVLAMPDGGMFIAAEKGLYALEDGELRAVESLKGTRVRQIIRHDSTVYVAANKGIWVMQNDAWKRIYRGDIRGISVDDSGTILAAAQRKGLMASSDGGENWSEIVDVRTALATIPSPVRKRSLEGFIRDLHKGKAFVGRKWAWLWIDLLGLLLICTASLGVFMWWRRRR